MYKKEFLYRFNFRCSKDSDIKTRKRKLEPLKQSELENLANNLDEISDLEDPYSSDDSVYDKSYDPEDDSEIDESEDSLDCDSQLDENETAEETQIVQSSGENDEEVVSNTIADQRNISDEELWVSEDEEPPEIAFLAQPCYNVHLPDDAKPIDYFYLTFSQDILDIVVQETNRRSEERKPKTTRSRKNTKNNWKELTVSELKQFLGLCCLGGMIEFPGLKQRWSRNRLYYHPIFGQVMPRNRFQAILKSLRFVDHANVDTTDRLYKIRVIIDKVLSNISKLVTPDRYLSLDESVLPWRGRLLFRQYLKNKSHKYGIKLYVLTTSDGFILNFLLYTGKGTIVSENSTHTAEVVKQLMKNYLNKGYWVFMDNYYNSVSLADYLVKNKTYVTGTLNPKRKDNPKSLMKKTLKKGEAAIKRKGPVLVTSWKDKRYVRMISTGHKHQMVEVTNRRGVKSKKPECIVSYNKYMSGIDRSDQMLSYYASTTKTIKWYRKVFFRLVDICIWNAFYLYRKQKDQKCRLLTFRESVINSLIDSGTITDPSTPSDHKDGTQHYLEPIPDTAKNRTVMRRCKKCANKQIRKQSRYLCPLCPGTPTLCVHPCFREWHEK